MSSNIFDLKELHGAYTRLTEKFKTFWTFHQFLQGIHKTFFSDAPAYQIDFQALYDQIKGVTSAMTFQPPAVVYDQIQQLDSRLEVVHRQLTTDDEKIAPGYVRRFFEKVRTEDEKLLVAILRFYFYARQVSPDTLDKMDFLITLVGSRRSLDDGHYLARFPQELAKLFGQLLMLRRRSEVPAGEKGLVVRALGSLKRDIDGCQRFEELSEKKILDNLRSLKRKIGPVYYDPDVLSAILEANLAAKNRFQALYRDEEKRIADSSLQLMEIERELSRQPDANGELLEELKKFHEARDDFEKKKSEGEIRHGQVTKLAESIDQLLSRLELPGEGVEEEAVEEPTTAAFTAAPKAPSIEDVRETVVNFVPGPRSTVPIPQMLPRPVEISRASAQAGADPLTSEHASKILFSVEMLDEGTGSGQAAYGAVLARLRLEPWEVRAARRILAGELPTQEEARARDLLFFDAAALRLRIDEEARKLKKPEGETLAPPLAPDQLNECGRCLVKAQDTDRRFRLAIEAAAAANVPEKLNELNRSRFRLLRAFSGLWLLHNARAGG